MATRLQKMGRSATVVIKLMIHVRRTHVVWVVTLKAKEVGVSEVKMQHAGRLIISLFNMHLITKMFPTNLNHGCVVA